MACGYRDVLGELLKDGDVERKQQSTGKGASKTSGSR